MRSVKQSAYLSGYLSKQASFVNDNPGLATFLYTLGGAGVGGTLGAIGTNQELAEQVVDSVAGARDAAKSSIDQLIPPTAQLVPIKNMLKVQAGKQAEKQLHAAKNSAEGRVTAAGGIVGGVGGAVTGLFMAELHKALARRKAEREE